MVMKGYFTLSSSSDLEPHHQTQFSVIPKTPSFFRDWGGSFLTAEDTVKVFLTTPIGRLIDLYPRSHFHDDDDHHHHHFYFILVIFIIAIPSLMKSFSLELPSNTATTTFAINLNIFIIVIIIKRIISNALIIIKYH